MATGKNILDRLRRARTERRRGVLPLIAFYGREPEQEQRRNRFYHDFARAMAMPDDLTPAAPARRALLFLDFETSIGVIDANASPIEWLVYRGEMESAADEEGMAGVRFHAAIRFRDLVDGARVNGMKAPSYSGLGGGGGGAVIDVRGYQLDCMSHLNRLRAAMPEQWLFPMLEAVVILDDWLDLRVTGAGPTAARRRHQTIAALHFGLDVVAQTLGYQSRGALDVRWPDGPPLVPHALLGHKAGPLGVTRAPVLPR